MDGQSFSPRFVALSYITKPWDQGDIRAKAMQAAQSSMRPVPPTVAVSVSVVTQRATVLNVANPVALDTSERIAQSTVRSTVMLVGHPSDECLALRQELGSRCAVLFADSVDHAIAQIERSQSAPDVMVVSLDAKATEQRTLIEGLKASVPGVVLVVICDTQYAEATMHLVNHAKVFRLLAAPAGKKLLLWTIERAIDKALELQREPSLIDAQRPALSAMSLVGPMAAHLRSIAASIKSRFTLFRR